MKEKISKIIILTIIFLLLSPISLDATSGACSSHNGVDCARGMQPNSKVYCNDSWIESIVPYTYMSECSNSSTCNNYSPSCKYLSDVNLLYLKKAEALIGVDKFIAETDDLYNKTGNNFFRTLNLQASIDRGRLLVNYIGYICDCVLIDFAIDKYANYPNPGDIPKKVLDKAVCGSNKFYGDTSKKCICNEGYSENNQGECIKIGQNNNIQNASPLICKANSTKVDNTCVCNDGYIMVGGNCISHTENCRKYYGQNVYGAKGNDNNSNCYCNSGYDWDSNKKSCIKQISSIIKNEKVLTGKLDKNLANRLSGYILIQSELNSTLWYLNPKDKKRYLLNSSTDLLKLIQNTAIFADSKLMAAYTKNPAKALGRFILDTKNSKKYYVSPKDKKFYELENYEWGYLKLKSLGLGITNADIRKIGVGEIK